MIISIKPWLEKADQPHHALLHSQSREILTGSAEKGSGGENPKIKKQGGVIQMAQKQDFYHESVLAQQVLDAMQPVRGKQLFDGTLGGGGHSEMFLERGAHVIACDQDSEALEYAGRRLERFGDCFLPVKGNFVDMDLILRNLGIDLVDGILLDLGVSSRQLDQAERGFSFRKDGPLDMRMDSDSVVTAKDLVNDLDEAELARIFFELGGERRSRGVAAAIVKARKECEISTTGQLAEIVAKVIPKTGSKNPATKVFQGLRIAVNREMECLESGIKKSLDLLVVGGVLAVITFHSLEDRLVKRFLRRHSAPFLDRPEWPEPKVNADYCLRLPSRKAITPVREELQANPRARSAKLRVAVKL